jgi:hypothetical protein
MPRLAQYLGRWILHSGWYPDRKIRLFDRKKAKWVGDYVHESVLVTGRVGHRQENILHSLKLTLGTKKTTPCGRGSEKLRFQHRTCTGAATEGSGPPCPEDEF